MGAASDPKAVVDEQLRVKGVKGLRVADTSIMPVLHGGHTQMPAYGIGEKAADHILGCPPLPPIDLPVYVASNWEKSQR